MPKKADKDYQKIGQLIYDIAEYGQINRKAIYRISFIKGLLSGFGGALGATILIGVLIWLLSLFSEVPLVGPFIENLRQTIKR